MRITAAAPESLIDDANQLAMVLAYGTDDANTYRGLNYQDADGNLYACASWEASPEFVPRATSPLVRPEWDTDFIIDMAAAERAQAALVFSEEAVQATPAALTAIGGMTGTQALAAMGLTAVPQEDL
jgi:hypothetical protein